MKKNIGLFFVLTVAASFLFWVISSNNEAFAVSGCCKVRKSENAPWGKKGTDLPACKKLNKQDNDNVLKKTGKVWWDMNC